MELHLAALSQLRAFVAVARHKSFKRAAQDLHVTQSALSHHVRHLEEALGTRLVERLHRKIALTDAGQSLFEQCRTPFETIAAAMQEARSRDRSGILTVSVAPYFSARWLTPRLGNLWSRHPQIEVQLRHTYQPADFLHDSVDAGISWGHGRWSEAEAELLMPGTLTAVCSTTLREKLPKRLKAEHLLEQRLLYEFDVGHWAAWFDAAGVSGRFSAVQIDDSHALRRAVLDGHGVGLFFEGLIEEDVRSGHLLRPFTTAIDSGSGYYFVRPRHKPIGQKLKVFSEWLQEEVRKQPFA